MSIEEQRLRHHMALVVSARVRAETLATAVTLLTWFTAALASVAAIFATPWWSWAAIAAIGFLVVRIVGHLARVWAHHHWYSLGRRVMAGIEPRASKE